MATSSKKQFSRSALMLLYMSCPSHYSFALSVGLADVDSMTSIYMIRIPDVDIYLL